MRSSLEIGAYLPIVNTAGYLLIYVGQALESQRKRPHNISFGGKGTRAWPDLFLFLCPKGAGRNGQGQHP